MTISERIMQVTNLNKNITMIEVNPTSFRKIKQDTLDYLKQKGIKVEIEEGANDLSFYTYKPDCFAYKNKQCMALTEINCANCSFYKNNITMAKLRQEIKEYNMKR